MKGGTLFSGIGAPECAMPWINWRWAAEINPFASAVHTARSPGVVNLGDVTTIKDGAVEPVDLVVFGSPCQSFSVAGKRLGLDDPRGNLALIALRLIGRIRPRWLVFENVPGLLSSDGGRDFGAFLGLLGQCGYGFAYRILDAQYAGVPQRRRRVFVVGYLGDWRPPAAVLFEPESLRGDTPPLRETGQATARPVGSCAAGGSGYRNDADTAENLIVATVRPPSHGVAWRGDGCDNFVAFRTSPNFGAWETGDRTDALTQQTDPSSHLIAFGGSRQSGPVDVATAVSAHGDGHDLEWRDDGTANAVLTPNGGRGGIGVGAVAFHENQRAEITFNETAGSLKVGGGKPGQGYPALQQGMSVRRLTPLECERLQGFPDNWTNILYRGKPAADGPRYRAIGNSMAVPVIGWIGHRIRLFEGVVRSRQEHAE